MAMFGLTLGALAVHRGDEKRQRENALRLAADAAFKYAVFLIITLPIQLNLPIVSENFSTTLLTLPVIAAITSVPYYYGGIVLSLCLTRTPYPIGKVYGIDLLGAATGCILALLIMETVDTPTGIIFICSAAAFSSLLFMYGIQDSGENKRKRKSYTIAAVFFLILALANLFIHNPIFNLGISKGHWSADEHVEYEKWNSISRVTVTRNLEDNKPYLWGGSPSISNTNFKEDYRMLVIDGDAATPITQFDGKDWHSLRYLEYDVTNLAYSIPGQNKGAIIGVGGGRDALSAKYFGLETVKAIDVNRTQIYLLTDHPLYSNYANLDKLDGVELIHNEARSWFRQNVEELDVIQMSLIDTYASTGAGAFALSENGLYTLEAWSTFFNDLSDSGVFTVSRWVSASDPSETLRMISLGVATLISNNVNSPRHHIFLAGSGNIATLILAKSPLTETALDALHKSAEDKQFKIYFTPKQSRAPEIMAHFLYAKTIEDLEAPVPDLPYNFFPPTDMQPFFFNQAQFTSPIQTAKMAFITKGSGVYHGHAKATFNLILIIIFSGIMVGITIAWPLSYTIKDLDKYFILSGTLFFLLIGIGFMLLEISLLQGMGVFLGHPIYGLSVVLFSLILSTGIGSLISEKHQLRNKRAVRIWSLTTFLYTVVLFIFLEGIFYQFSDTSLAVRSLTCFAVIFPLGILLGYGFPTGMRFANKINSRATTWFWGMNGAAGVLSSALAIAFSISFGIDKTIILGGLCYALLSLTVPGMVRK
jgi:predicted membrane-bound spermidine synthase